MSVLARPVHLFKTLALAEGVTWTLLLLGMLGKYVLDLGQLGVRVGGALHGFVFLTYCLVTTMLAVDRRWPVSQWLLGLGAAVAPYATIPFERHAEQRGLLSSGSVADPGEPWQLRGRAPNGPLEVAVAAAVRRPGAALAIGLLAVALVFCGLLLAGPPTEWFA